MKLTLTNVINLFPLVILYAIVSLNLLSSRVSALSDKDSELKFSIEAEGPDRSTLVLHRQRSSHMQRYNLDSEVVKEAKEAVGVMAVVQGVAAAIAQQAANQAKASQAAEGGENGISSPATCTSFLGQALTCNS